MTRDIFIICNNVEELGGLQRWAHHIATLMSERGHDVQLIGVERPEERHDYGVDPPYRVSHLNEGRPPSAWKPRRLWGHLDVRARLRERGRRAAFRRAVGTLNEAFSAAGPGAVVIVPQVFAMRWVSQADRATLPLVGMSHESFAASSATWRRRGVRDLFAEAERLLLLTREDADAWARDGMSNVGVMPNPVPIVPEQPARSEAKVVASLGRFSHEKGYDLLLEAWARVAPEHPDWTLRLYGNGPLEEDLQAQAMVLGIDETVDFAGLTTDVEAALRDCSVFALASRAEGFPVSLLEAGAMGLPSVCFSCAPGVREIVEDGETGMLIRPGNVEQFAESLHSLMGDEELRRTMGQAARERVSAYSPRAVMDLWESVFDLVHR